MLHTKRRFYGYAEVIKNVNPPKNNNTKKKKIKIIAEEDKRQKISPPSR